MEPSAIISAIGSGISVLEKLSAAVADAANHINELREIARQNAELTDEQDAEIDKKIRETMANAPHWKTDSPPAS